MEPGASVDGWKKWIEDPDKPKDFEYVSAADYDKKMQQKQNQKPAKKEESKAATPNIFARYQVLPYILVGLFISYLIYDVIHYYTSG